MKTFPKEYKTKLDFQKTEKGIKLVKDTFERKLAEKLKLQRVTAPRFLITGTGLQDDLAGTQKPVSFKSKFEDKEIEIVHSLAKWKRFTLGRFDFKSGTGIYTDMDAIRKDEDISPIHSIYVDQWDWEKIMDKKERTLKYLKSTVKKIYEALLETEEVLTEKFSELKRRLPKQIHFVHSEDLEKEYPKLSPKEREKEIARKHKAVFLIGIGHPLASGKPHDLRAADYDDWSSETKKGKKGLDGDIIVWDDIRQDSLELSSMGIRVDAKALMRQLSMHDLLDRKYLEFHKGILEDKLPQTIGGGIGQSRLCMFMLQKAHIGEVHSSVWPKEVKKESEQRGITLL